MRWRLHSTSVRLAAVVGVSFLLGFALLGGLVYFTVSSLLYADAREVIRVDAGGLRDLYEDGGERALSAELRQRLAQPADPDALYALRRWPSGHVLAGNIAELPRPLHGRADWLRLRQAPAADSGAPAAEAGEDDTDVPSLLLRQRVGTDLELITGLRLRSESGFLALGIRTIWMALLLAAALGLLLGGLIARWVSRRLYQIEDTVARVGEGDIDRRVRSDGSGDAFDLLALRFNRMLDRIQVLLSGVREATDHIAHDLRTPLTRLRTRLEMLRAESPASAAGLEPAIAEVDQLLQSSQALLRLARVEAQPPASDDPLRALAPLVRDAMELYEPIAAERGIRLGAELDGAQVPGDADQLFQLLINLLDNAVKYSPPQREVRVRLVMEAAGARLEVADQGSGIPPEDHERVFDRFHRLEKHRGSPGTGLGLSLVRAIVLRHRGQIRLADNHPGLRVVVWLPAGRD
jgi:signal transduction histidine kinase